MSSYLTISWADAKPGEMMKPKPTATPAERMQSAVDALACVREAVAQKRPSVLFVFSEEKEPPAPGARSVPRPGSSPAANEPLTAAAKRSLIVYERVFENVQDIPLRILLRFFRCTRLDVTKVPGSAHPDLSEPNAPLVLMVDAQGNVAQVLSQMRIDSRSLCLGMRDILKKGGLKEVDALCTESSQRMEEMEKALIAKGKIEIKMNELRASLAECEAKDRKRPARSGAPPGPSDSTVRARKAVNDLQPALEAAEQAFTALKEQDAALLRKAGVVPRTGPMAPPSPPSPAPLAGQPRPPPPANRIWTSVSGVTLEASFSGLQADMVILARPDGRTVQIPLGKLSPADQAVARRFASATSP